METFYGRICGKFWRQENPKSEREYYGLLVMMLDLHIRNVAYAEQPEDNFEDYLIRTAGVRNQVLFGEQGKPSSEADVINLWRNHWAVRIVQADSDRTFLTSDNPSMWFRADEGFGEVNLVLMPVTPYAYAVAFDRRVLDFRPGATTEADETWLTRFQVSHCVECIYTAERLSDEQLSIARQLFARKTNQPPTMDANHTWRMNLFRLPNFSFIVRKSLPLWL